RALRVPDLGAPAAARDLPPGRAPAAGTAVPGVRRVHGGLEARAWRRDGSDHGLGSLSGGRRVRRAAADGARPADRRRPGAALRPGAGRRRRGLPGPRRARLRERRGLLRHGDRHPGVAAARLALTRSLEGDTPAGPCRAGSAHWTRAERLSADLMEDLID